MRLALLVALILGAASAAFGASVPDYSGLAYEQRLGNQIPLQQRFRDDGGRDVALAELAAPDRPLILALVYFHCPNLCGVVRSDLFDALKRSGMTAGRDYSLVALSIDPSESSTDAKAAKGEDMQRFPSPGAADNWHFLTGSTVAVRVVADSVGFRERYDPEIKQFIHPVGIVFATSTGIVSSYLLGVGYQPGDVRVGVTRAQSGTVAAAVLPVLLVCFHYDPTTGRYTLSIMKLLRLTAAITVAVVAITLFLAFRRDGGRT